MMRGAQILAVVAAFAAFAALADDGQLAGVRKLGERMLKDARGGGDSAYCELAHAVAGNGCLGPGGVARRIRVGGDGRVEIWAHQTLPGSGEPVGYSRGRIAATQWKDLLRALAALRPEQPPPGMPMPLPPEPGMPSPVLTLSDGKARAEYRHAGMALGSIGDAFARIEILSRSAADSVWRLSLIRPAAEIRKDSVHVTAEWSWSGPAGARVLFSGEGGGASCGRAAFKWYLDTSAAAVEWRTATVAPGKGRGMSWDFPGSKANLLRLAFPYNGPKGKAKRVGVLDGIGIRVVPGGSKDTVSATALTGRFAF